jgi:hypothetical protein
MPPDHTYPSFAIFVEGVVLPRLLEFPERKRLDGWDKGGNIEVAGRFSFGGAEWVAHEDCHFDPLLLAYWSARVRGESRTFERSDTKRGVRLDLVPDLQALRPSRWRYLYLYLAAQPRT